MSTRKKQKPKTRDRLDDTLNGPHITAAAICQDVIEAKDGTLSAIRLIDVITLNLGKPTDPNTPFSVSVPVTLLIALKSGQAKGKKLLSIALVDPKGVVFPSNQTFPLVLEGDEHGANVVIRTEVITNKDGLFWFDIRLDGQLLSRQPLRVKFEWLQPDKSSSENSTTS